MTEEISRSRSALGDVTNQVEKRGFSLISTSGTGGDDYQRFQLAKKECLRLDNFTKENCCKEIKEPCPPGVGENATSSILIKASGDDTSVSVQVESKGKAENRSGIDRDNDVNVDNITDSSKDEYIDSQESRCGFEGCFGQKGNGLSSKKTMDLIKACSCSFCVKAAYLWSDLHYQDIKGRIAVINKSRKEASILVNRNSRDGAIARCGQISNLDSDLTGRWNSLFLHMEDMFVREATQLETSLSTLKELRDNCKTDSDKN